MTSDVPDTVVARWERALEQRYGRSYWPGPWTLDNDRHDQLIGRRDVVRELVYLIRDKQLTVLSGDSGVGKSSLLEAGLIPALVEDGYIPLRCDDWYDDQTHDTRDSAGLWAFLEDKFRADIVARGIERDDRPLPEQLNEAFGRRAILILDQFEEVIRQQPQLYAALFTLIEETVDTTRIRIVVSLRAEYAYHLKDLEVSYVRRLDQVIPPIRDSRRIRNIINSGRASGRDVAEVGQKVITDDAVDLIVTLWEDAGATDRKSRVRLLHLQALLFSLWYEHDRHEARPPIDADAVADFIARAKDAVSVAAPRQVTAEDLARGVFEGALANVVTLHVELCSEVLAHVRPSGFRDTPLDEGVRHALVSLSEYLSSGGYKVDQEETHLLELVLAEELKTLGVGVAGDSRAGGADGVQQIVQRFATLAQAGGEFDWIASSTDELAHELGVRSEGSDTDDVSAGALLGIPRLRVAMEECRRFFLALAWLKAGKLVRLSPSDGGKNFVALSHDGFGRGLNEWALDNRDRPETYLHAITASFGKSFSWQRAGEHTSEVNPLFGEEGDHKVYVNLRWRSCRLIGTPERPLRLEHVVFMNCDLRGTSFEQCEFKGVKFVNCLLDGVQFIACTVIGSVSEFDPNASEGPDMPLPSFARPDSDEIVATLQHYRGTRIVDPGYIYSRTSGVAVEPAGDRGHRERDDGKLVGTLKTSADGADLDVSGIAVDEAGGLTMAGGRLSSLAFYACTFVPGAETDESFAHGEFSLRHVAGTSLDFLEHKGGKITLYDTAVRGITVSPPISAMHATQTPVEIEFLSVDSHVENVWFSAGLSGSARFESSMAWQVFNGSQRNTGGLRVELDESSLHLGVENIPDANIRGVEMGWSQDGPSKSASPFAHQKPEWYDAVIRKFAARIDYRSPDTQRAFDDLSDE